jgi:hypothetical protein
MPPLSLFCYSAHYCSTEQTSWQETKESSSRAALSLVIQARNLVQLGTNGPWVHKLACDLRRETLGRQRKLSEHGRVVRLGELDVRSERYGLVVQHLVVDLCSLIIRQQRSGYQQVI